MKKLIKMIMAALALISGASWAGDVSETQARTAAAYFVAKDSVGKSVLADRNVDAVTAHGGLWLVTLRPSGYLMVSANRAASPIAAFSEYDFEEPAAGSPQAAVLAAAETNAINATGTAYETQWRTMLGERTPRRALASAKTTSAAETTYVNIAPLVSSSWSQGYPYSELTPIINGSHTPVGCVATAYSQILRFWEWPERLDEDVVTEHSVDGLWGHAWRLKAGTLFDWGDMPHSGGYDNATRLKLGRAAMLAGMIARMTYNTKASGTQTSQPGINRWYTPYRVLDTSNATLTEREEGMKASLLNGCPFMVSLDYVGTGHAVVGDGWQENANGKYVHLNYGWGYNNSYYGTTTPLGVYLDQRPRPMVMNKPLPTKAALPLTVAWSFPTKGYDTTLTGFEISYTEVADAIADWCDDMSGEGTGTIDGDCIGVETVDASGHGNVMRVGTKADEETYTWPTMVATADTDLSFDIHSWNALGMTVEVQLLDPSVGWITLATPEIGEQREIEWTTHTYDLAAYAGKGIAVRVKATRSGSSSYNDDNSRATGVQFDNIRLTQVRQSTKTVVGTKTAAKADRSLAIDDAALTVGKTYLFQVTPTFNDNTIEGIPGYAASCTIAAADSAQPTIESVESVSASAPKMQDGMFRECFFGLNQFGVYGSSAMTKLEAYLSNLAVIGEVEIQDTTQPEGTMITVHDKVSIADAVTVAKKAEGRFLVKVDASKLTTYLNYTGMILTLIGRNDAGDAVQKDICLRFVKSGSETEIAVADLPEPGVVVDDEEDGSGDTPSTPTEPDPDPGEEPSEPSEPDPESEDEREEPGGDDPVVNPPVVDPSGGNSTDDGTTRFCSGVTATAGAQTVTRSGTLNRLVPASYNLLLWWIDRYYEANGQDPVGYTAPNTSSIPSDGSYTIQSFTAKLIDDTGLSATLPAGTEREKYFPSNEFTPEDWYGSATGDGRAKAIGRKIYEALDNGPIGIRVRASLGYVAGAVIWGCDYANDGDVKYATKLYITDTTLSKDVKLVQRDLGCCTTTDGNYSGVGVKSFNSSNNGIIERFYPIAGPAGASEEPDTPEPDPEPDPVPSEDDPIGFADNDGNPGNNYTATYQYEMYDNYYTARKRAIQQGKQLFILSGASWCSNCAFVKSYLTTLGAAFTSTFVVYYSNHDDDVSSPYFHGGLPQYGAADPRAVDAFTGTLDGTTRTWSSVWTTAGCGVYRQDRGGYASERVDTVVAAGQAKAAYAYPTNLAVRGLATLATGHAGQYELYAQFADGVEMPVDYGVTWTIVSGNGSLAEANVDGRRVTALTIDSGDVVLRATSTFYFTGTKTITVRSTDLANVESVAINTTSVNLEDDAAPLLDAVATMKDGSEIAVVGFGDWSAAFKSRIPRADADLEEDNQSPTITFDPVTSRLTYAKTYGKLEVCDQKIDVTLVVNGKSVTKEITVWGPTKVAPSQWKMISGPRQTALGVVRLQCTELKYNYGGQILRTKDTYFASFKTVLKQGSTTVDTSLRGLTAYAFSEQSGTCTVGLSATKVNGKYTGYTPADPTASELATNFTNVAKGTTVTGADKGSVPAGFFQAFFPNATSDTYETLADADSDGDGFKNWEEYVLGTDPTDTADAFTLMQCYQHLAAPAADGETMQYKVMYAQRARRIYYIEAKNTWSDAWTPVATVSLANAAESDVTSFTALNADEADAAKFFRVRASLYEHVFNDPDNAPKITPNMLVAAPGAVIDLTNETLPLVLTSFDTDATDPGTVYMRVPANVTVGTVLMTAPAAAARSMAALAAKDLADGLKLVVAETSDDRLALKVASAEMPAVPVVEDDPDALVEGDAESGFTVTPGKEKKIVEVTIPTGVASEKVTVEVGPQVEKITPHGAKLKIVKNGHDITDYLDIPSKDANGAIELSKATVKAEIAQEPLDAAKGAEITLEPTHVRIQTANTRPGLTYTLKEGTSILDMKAGDSKMGDGEPWTPSITVKGGSSAFYTIEVGK